MPKNLWQVPQQLPLRSDARGMERGEVPQTWKIQFQQEGSVPLWFIVRVYVTQVESVWKRLLNRKREEIIICWRTRV